MVDTSIQEGCLVLGCSCFAVNLLEFCCISVNTTSISSFLITPPFFNSGKRSPPFINETKIVHSPFIKGRAETMYTLLCRRALKCYPCSNMQRNTSWMTWSTQTEFKWVWGVGRKCSHETLTITEMLPYVFSSTLCWLKKDSHLTTSIVSI